ncbi:hypothetical protein [Rhizobium sp. M1]|uniref:hypothetical protein n=1 Tax=Rhizobium sp. M1 TaxID=2035453 RepID=UPI000BE82F1C|nr:hypothetical protein [Rhizobium sp. M1]PDT07874.1 hypothetical protein CO655_24955 [Rhizobium sp. M1]
MGDERDDLIEKLKDVQDYLTSAKSSSSSDDFMHIVGIVQDTLALMQKMSLSLIDQRESIIANQLAIKAIASELRQRSAINLNAVAASMIADSERFDPIRPEGKAKIAAFAELLSHLRPEPPPRGPTRPKPRVVK